jgi:hypothetical protein
LLTTKQAGIGPNQSLVHAAFASALPARAISFRSQASAWATIVGRLSKRGTQFREALVGGHDLGRVGKAPRCEFDFKVHAGHALYRVDNFKHREAVTITAIERQRRPTRAQMAQRI